MTDFYNGGHTPAFKGVVSVSASSSCTQRSLLTSPTHFRPADFAHNHKIGSEQMRAAEA